MRIPTCLTILVAPLALAACGSGEDTRETADMPMADDMAAGENMPMMQSDETGQTASADGTVTAIDEDAGTITIDHGPVPEVSWPAMTMGFAADEATRQKVAEGDEVTFAFRTTEGGASEIVSISKK